jgi:hypothetical protein
VLVVLLVADVAADVVQHGAELEPLALPGPESVPRGGGIEQREGQPGDLLGVLRPVATSRGVFSFGLLVHQFASKYMIARSPPQITIGWSSEGRPITSLTTKHIKTPLARNISNIVFLN